MFLGTRTVSAWLREKFCKPEKTAPRRRSRQRPSKGHRLGPSQKSEKLKSIANGNLRSRSGRRFDAGVKICKALWWRKRLRATQVWLGHLRRFRHRCSIIKQRRDPRQGVV